MSHIRESFPGDSGGNLRLRLPFLHPSYGTDASISNSRPLLPELESPIQKTGPAALSTGSVPRPKEMMHELSTATKAPLGRFSEAQTKHMLRGYPKMAVDAAIALRSSLDHDELERCLTGIFLFYLPPGTEIEEAQLSGDLSLRDGLGLDSLSLAEAMFKVEELFETRVENSELTGIETIADACRLLLGKLDSSGAGCDSDA